MLTEFAGCYLMDSLISLFSSISEASLSLSFFLLFGIHTSAAIFKKQSIGTELISHLTCLPLTGLTCLLKIFLEFVD